MTDDSDDSILRKVAAAPAVPPPVQSVTVLVVEVPGEADVVARVQAVVQPSRADVVPHRDGALLTVSGTDGGRQAALWALAMRDVFPRARLALATGGVVATVVDRAGSLLERDEGGVIQVDDETADLLDASFDVHGAPAHRTLAAKRGAQPAAVSRVADPIDKALAEEQLRAARAAQVLRVVALAVWVLSLGIIYVVEPTASRRVQLYVLVPYFAAALLSLLARNVIGLRYPSHLLTVFLDIPAFGALAIAVSTVAPAEATWACGMCTALCCMAVAGACTALRPVLVIASTISAVVVLTATYLLAHQPATSVAGVIALLATAFFGFRLMRRIDGLLRRVVEEATGRVHEVELLNEELRRQIGDRARQLASALARLQSSAEPRPLESGLLVDERYRVVRGIGKGGMGAVYEVERVADGRHLALKVLTGVADRTALARFAREAQLAVELDHPNIVSVLDVDVSGSGMLFLVMQLVAGGSLAGMRDRYGDVAWARPILIQLGEALVAMHARGIVHRDLKPSNVLLDGSVVKVADFGLASLRASADEPVTPDGQTALDDCLTRTGVVMGTPFYMAPELAGGARNASPASDMFSLGVLAYELVANQLPRASPAPLRALCPELPEALAEIVDRCLSSAPENRPTAQHFVASLA